MTQYLASTARCVAVLLSAALWAGCATGPAAPPETETTTPDALPSASEAEAPARPAADNTNPANPDFAAPDPAERAARIWTLLADRSGLVHKASGMTCPSRCEGFMLTGDNDFPGLGEGNDVACVFEDETGSTVWLHLTHFGRDVRPSAHLKGVVTSITDAHAQAVPAPIPSKTNALRIDDQAAFDIVIDTADAAQTPIQTAVWIEQVGAWHVKIRASYSPKHAEKASALVTSLFQSARVSLSASRSTPSEP